MIERNAVFAVGNRTFRLLDFDGRRDAYWAIDLGKENAWPYKAYTDDLIEKVVQGSARAIEDPTLKNAIPEDALTEKARKRLDKNWPAIEALLATAPDIFVPSLRGKRVREIGAEYGLSLPTVRKLLRQALQGGGVKAAITPAFDKCGGPDKPRLAKPGGIKRGRRGPGGIVHGRNFTDDDRTLMIVVWEKFRPKKLDCAQFKRLYREFKQRFWVKVGIDPGDTQAVTKAIREGAVVSLGQFIYQLLQYLEKEQPEAFRKLRRAGRKAVKLIHSTSQNDAPYPGYRYQIDATIADIYLRSKHPPYRIVGRPTLYLVVDVASRLIAGYYLSFDKPSWGAALMALANVCEDKVSHCARYGVNIAPEDWPTAPLPVHVLGDRGEMISHGASRLTYFFGTDVENAPPYSAASKGVVERYFGTIQAEFKAFAPGVVEEREFGAEDYRLEAALDIDEFRAIILRSIVTANINEKRGFHLPESALEAGVPPIPAKIWEHYRSKGQLHGKHVDPALITMLLRPRKRVTVTRSGIRLANNLHYEAADLLASPWYDDAVDQGLQLEAIYDPLDLSEIHVVDPNDPSRYVRCELVAACHQFRGRSWREITKIRIARKQVSAAAAPEAEAKTDRYLAEAHDVIDKAAKRALEQRDPNESKASRVANIRNNQAEERRADKLRNRPDVIEGECVADSAQGALPAPMDPGADEDPYLDFLTPSQPTTGDDND